MRTFIAVDLSSEIKDRLSSLIRTLRPLGAAVKWVSRESMHLTLKFLGEIDEQGAEAVRAMLSTSLSGIGPIPLACRGTGYFPPGSKSPRVLWAGIEAAPALARLQENVESGCVRLGFPREERPFQPHLTLGRVKSPSRLAPLLAEFERRREEDFGRMEAQRLTFFRSRLNPSGAEYSVLAEFPLA
jgi:2'-5' RNA ligase